MVQAHAGGVPSTGRLHPERPIQVRFVDMGV